MTDAAKPDGSLFCFPSRCLHLTKRTRNPAFREKDRERPFGGRPLFPGEIFHTCVMSVF